MATKEMYVRSYEAGTPLIGPDVLQIAMTHRCNLRCLFCHVRNDLGYTELTTDDYKSLISQFRDMDGKRVLFVGGEPLLRPDIFELIGFGKKLDLRVSINTNGTLFNEQVVQKFLDCGLASVCFSIDGPPDIHNRLRGENVFERADRSIDLVRRTGRIDFGMICIVMDSNLEHLEQMIDFAEHKNMSYIYFQPLQTNNTKMWEKRQEHKEWIKGARLKVLDTVLDRISKRKAKLDIFCDADGLRQYFGMEKIDRKCYQDYLRIVIKPDGTYWTCHEINSNIFIEPLKDYWLGEKMQEQRRLSRSCPSKCLQICTYADRSNIA